MGHNFKQHLLYRADTLRDKDPVIPVDDILNPTKDKTITITNYIQDGYVVEKKIVVKRVKMT
jgi:hypothetical protein